MFISTINGIKSNTRAHEEQLTRHVRELEEEYVANPTDCLKASWVSAQDALSKLLVLRWKRSISFPG